MTDLATIRAWASDPAAPPDDACGYVSDLLAEIDRLEAERAALLAPAEGVDVAEVLRLSTVPARTPSAAEDRDGELAYAAPLLAREVVSLRARLAATEDERDEMAAAGRTVVEAADEMRSQWAEIEERLIEERDEARQRADNAYAEGLADGLSRADDVSPIE